MKVEMQTLLRADELGVRLEIVRSLPLWEAQPVVRHQRAIDRIRSTIWPTPPTGEHDNGCGCVHLADVYVRFPDGSLKRPDISLFCQEPDEEEDAVHWCLKRSSKLSAVGSKPDIWRSVRRFT